MMDDGRWLMLLLLIEYEVQTLLAVEIEFTVRRYKRKMLGYSVSYDKMVGGVSMLGSKIPTEIDKCLVVLAL